MWNNNVNRIRNLLGASRENTISDPKGRPVDSNAVPDLLADNDKLYAIIYVRDAVRSLRKAARERDRTSSEPLVSFDADMRRYCLLACGRIIGGQRRELSERDRLCLEQIVGFQVASEQFSAISQEIRWSTPQALDAVCPALLKAQATVRIPGDGDQRSEVMSITIPK